jgi:hypothetical protein
MSYHQRTRSDSPILTGGGSRRISLPAQEACEVSKPIMPPDIGLCKPSRQSQISEQYEILNKNLAVLSDLVSSLESKFDPILRPLQPCAEGACAEKEAEPLAPLAAALRERNRQLQNLNGRIANLNSRNEL